MQLPTKVIFYFQFRGNEGENKNESAMLHVTCQSGSTEFNALHSVKILSLVVLDQHLAVSDWILYN